MRTAAWFWCELLILLTPHVVRTKADAERIMAEETRKMNWCLEDVTDIHGPLFEVPPPPKDGKPAEELPAPRPAPPSSTNVSIVKPSIVDGAATAQTAPLPLPGPSAQRPKVLEPGPWK
jgi:hypothetical protein